jgi:hypothetical protein
VRPRGIKRAGVFFVSLALPILFARVNAGADDRVQVLSATGGLPAHIAGQFREPINFQQSQDGQYFVFDRRGHSVYRVDPEKTAVKKIVQIGQEEGRIIEPTAFDLEQGGQSFAVADAPNQRERVQFFTSEGFRLGGFTLPGRAAPRITIGSLVLNGVGSLQFTDRAIGLSGTPVRTIGALRATGQEPDRDVHLALNVGLPLAHPKGGFYFVFQSGVPMFRRYDARGTLLFERHVEGPELDGVLAAMPTSWPRSRSADDTKRPEGELPLMLPTVRTAAVDRVGNLWVVLSVPYAYVYDAVGDKRRTVQFRGAGTIAPSSLFFTANGRLLVTPGCYEFRP